MALPLPTKTQVRYCSINGLDVTRHVNSISIHETVCKPYLTATLKILDTNNVLNNLKLVGGEKVYIAFDGNPFRVYQTELYVLAIQKGSPNQNLRAMYYTLDLIGQAYFKDRVNLVQQSFKGVTGTSAIGIIHNSYVGGDAPLSILSGSVGLLAKDNPYIVQSTKPFKAIDDIRRTLNFAQYQTGNSLYYRDRDGYVLAPLEQLFAQLSPQDKLVQKATFGHTIQDYTYAEKSIMAAELDVHGTPNGVGELASASNQGKTVFDLNFMKIVNKSFPSLVSPGAVIGTALVSLIGKNILQGSTNGGEPNFQVMDTKQRPTETDTSSKTERERLYAATAKAGPRISVKVPIQSGVNCTVGKGVNLQLSAPYGDMNGGLNGYSGNWLVIDLVHEVSQGDVMYNATTTLKCIRGGIN